MFFRIFYVIPVLGWLFDQIIITTPKAFVGGLAGWGGKLWYSHHASQEYLPGNSWDTVLGRAAAPQSWAGREGTFLQHCQPKTPRVQLQEHPALLCCQGTPQESQVPAGNHSWPCSGSHSLAGKWLYPKSPCSSMSCTWRFWSPQTWNLSRPGWSSLLWQKVPMAGGGTGWCLRSFQPKPFWDPVIPTGIFMSCLTQTQSPTSWSSSTNNFPPWSAWSHFHWE